MQTLHSKRPLSQPLVFGNFEHPGLPGDDAEAIRKEVALAKEKLRKHPKFFERFGSTKPKRKTS